MMRSLYRSAHRKPKKKAAKVEDAVEADSQGISEPGHFEHIDSAAGDGESECLAGQTDDDDDLFGDDRPKKFSSGKSHGALVRLGMAKAAVGRAKSVLEVQSKCEQDIARVVFSHYGRGGNSANTRHV